MRTIYVHRPSELVKKVGGKEALRKIFEEQLEKQWINHDHIGFVTLSFLEEAIESMKKFVEFFGGRIVDYSVGVGTQLHVKIDWSDAPEALQYVAEEDATQLWGELTETIKDKACPFTGMYYDDILLEQAEKEVKDGATITWAIQEAIKYLFKITLQEECNRLQSFEEFMEADLEIVATEDYETFWLTD